MASSARVGFPKILLSFDLVTERSLDHAERVEIFDFRFRVEAVPFNGSVVIQASKRDIGVATHMSLFHISIRHAKGTSDQTNFMKIGFGFFRGPKIRFRNKFDQGDAGTIVVDKCFSGGRIMNIFRRVFLQVETLDTNFDGAAFFVLVLDFDEELSVLPDREIKLRDLVSFGKIGVKIVFAVKLRVRVDCASDGRGHQNTHFNGAFVWDGKRPWVC
ncbi:MAG: hypothetical protein UY81_C0046G0003 [Candidatus Giovannonibacteria bacterium GW2011_GWA2_53_7]|uniref:Uncharacterized protein n=1 Tax=Candidatus Giovannonibacteria bacterium GW2011_GWA2_53_7 TaxID=1618650 RepID=A0A0G1XWJ8_9BACT|nr:MAG: hypothetical protein UY81_C0046G0003 [Candidatus Giovannonibacteria bacterium GW2011_GWA2_53_7]